MTENVRYWTAEKVIEAIQKWAAKHDGTPPSYVEWNPSQARKAGHPERAEEWVVAGVGSYPSAWTVSSVFGSWNKGIAAAGYAPRQAGWGSIECTGFTARPMNPSNISGLKARSTLERLYQGKAS